MLEIDRHDTDILILGTGGAGMFAALHAQQTAPELRALLANVAARAWCRVAIMWRWGAVTP